MYKVITETKHLYLYKQLYKCKSTKCFIQNKQQHIWLFVFFFLIFAAYRLKECIELKQKRRVCQGRKRAQVALKPYNTVIGCTR